jgi:hypothetical protein
MKQYFFLILLLTIFSCERDKSLEPVLETPSEEESTLDYSFFVAGHTYGNPFSPQYGLYPPFVDQIPFVNSYPAMQLGVLTGDVVLYPTQEYWDSARVDINKFSVPIHIAAGNHDRSPLFEELYDSYYSFWKEDDLFIILSPTNWNIEEAQQDFLIETIESSAPLANNIFIFCHELIWWAPDNEFGNIKINFSPHYPGSTNYWSEISPFLESFPNKIVIFAGDLGAKADVDPYMYYEYENITLIASGMGGGAQDNIIVAEVSVEGAIKYKLLGINGEVPVELGKLKDYELP